MAQKAKSSSRRRGQQTNLRQRKPKPCYFCKEKIDYIDYKDVAVLRNYMSDRAKIRARRVTGNCAQHQRKVARAIRNAREMAILPYIKR